MGHDAAMLDRIQLLTRRGDIRFSSHAYLRMDERNASEEDVERGILTAATCVWQDDHQSWRCTGGVDCGGDVIMVAVVVEANVIVRTIT